MEIKLIPGTCQCCRFLAVESFDPSPHGVTLGAGSMNDADCSKEEEIKKYFVVPGAVDGVGDENHQCPLWEMIELKFCSIKGHGWYSDKDGCIACEAEYIEQSRGNEYNPLPS